MPLSKFKSMALIIAVVIAVDQLSKYLAVTAFSPGELYPVIPGFFNLTLTYNPGAAFGLFRDLPDFWRALVLSLTTALALAVAVYFLLREYREHPLARSALALILGGAGGNIIDRLRYGKVVDFLDVYYGTWHWPAFNFADSAICTGVVILLFCRPSQQK